MYEAFVSVIVPIDARDDSATLAAFLQSCADELSRHFTDYELIVIDNRSHCTLDARCLDSEVAHNCYVVRLAAPVSWDVAVFSGLERANGDYVVVFDSFLADYTCTITQMYEAAQEGHDYVVLQQAQPSWPPQVQRRAFFWLMHRTSPAAMEIGDRKELLISRRALNWALRHRARARYLHELYATGGFATKKLLVELAEGPERRSARHRSDIAWGAMTRMTDYPLRVAQAGLALLSLVLFLAVLNAMTVRLLGRNLLGGAEVGFPGWAYLVLLVSVGFLMTNVVVYAVLRVLKVLADDLRDEPLYIVEQMRRVG